MNYAFVLQSADSVKEKLQMEREVNHVQSVMNSLERQRTSLANQMDTLRRTQAKGEHDEDMMFEEDRWWNGEQSFGKGVGARGACCMKPGDVVATSLGFPALLTNAT